MTKTRVATAVLALTAALATGLAWGQAGILDKLKKQNPGFVPQGAGRFHVGVAEASYDAATGKASLRLPAAEITRLLDPQLNSLEGYHQNSDTETCYIKNFRSSISGRNRVTVKVDYEAKRRGKTKNLIGGWAYSSWVKDSGTVTLNIRVTLSDWQVNASIGGARAVEVDSRNWFTDFLLSAGFDGYMRQQIVPKVQAGLDEALGGDALDLRKLFVKAAPPEIARATGLPEAAVRDSLRRGLAEARLDGDISSAGVAAVVSVKGLLPAKEKPKAKPKGAGLAEPEKVKVFGRIQTWRDGKSMVFVTNEGKQYTVALTPQTTYSKVFPFAKPPRVDEYVPRVKEMPTFEHKNKVTLWLDRDDPQRAKAKAVYITVD